jgi:hypothetical protein
MSLKLYILISNLITLTELVGNPRIGVLKRLIRFDHFKYERSDAAVMWRRRRFRPLHTFGIHVGETDAGARRHVWASAVALRDKKSKRKIVVSSLHLVSDVESDLYKALTEPVRPQRAADFDNMLRTWVQTVETFAANIGADEIILACDANLNYHKAWVKTYAAGITGDTMRVTWRGHEPTGAPRGTHGNRLIDWAFATRGLRVLKIRILKQNKASDHRAFTEVLEYR